jgi:hypothetical protein
MKKNNPYWRRRKSRPGAKSQPEKKGFFNKLYEAFESQTIKAIVLTVVSVLLFCFVYIAGGYTNFGDWVRQKQEKVNDFTVTKHYSLEGIVVDCDSIPIPGITVVIKGYDVASTKTDENGFFTAYVQLPAELTDVSIRFVDSLKQEIYSTRYTLDKNSIDGDQILVYSIPDQNLNRKSLPLN